LSPQTFNTFWHALAMPLCARLPHSLGDWLCVKAFERNTDYKANVYAALAQSLPKGLLAFEKQLAQNTGLDCNAAGWKFIAQRYFEMMARECCDIYCLNHQGPRYLQDTVRFDNLHDFEAVYKKPGGKLLLLFHFDRLTLISSALGQAGFSHGIITQPIDETNPDLSPHDRRFLAMKVKLQQTMAGGGWFVAGRDTRGIVQALQNGETLILLPDVRPGSLTQRVVKLPFLGQTLTIPDGAVRLADITGATMIAGLCKSEGRQARVSFLPLQGSSQAALGQAVQWLESAILEAPHRWWQWNIFDYLVSHEP
jgi:lauroyl/myristoyl acyltransferase